MTGVLVHEWIAQSGGSENVLEAMGKVYPDAQIVCLWNDSRGRFEDERVRETWLARSPLRRSKAAALPFMPLTWRTLRDRDYEWALVSSHLFAHHVTFRDPGIDRHVYVHTPARYIWNPELDARGATAPARAIAVAFKGVDRRRAREGAQFAANSEFVRRRIARAWGVDARVIHPPVEVTAIQSRSWVEELTDAEREQYDSLPDAFVLGASRFIPYKRLDLVIRAGEITHTPVVLAGRGPERTHLERRAADATVPVTFVHSPSDAFLRALYAKALVYVFPAIEDFGIMPVEAMAAGCPVVGQSLGGTAESVVPGASGALTRFDDDDDIARAMNLALTANREVVAAHARAYARERFNEQIREWVGR
ncbi:glycosyltransferase [Demequina sp. NBRC 110055]|uniref:glycosyltransferase n=1 Tax=Demequina sp. NBRC 110055 TaxID=1570344 RepID=UPI0009FBD806|nr:glycosyltransferase [Demequina sp. NBRC 110055]